MFREKLKKARSERGLTQTQVSTAIDLTLRSYQALEYGESSPSFETLIQLCKCLQVSADYLLDISNNEMISNNNVGRKPKQSKYAKYLLDMYESLDEKDQIKMLSFAFDLANNKTN